MNGASMRQSFNREATGHAAKVAAGTEVIKKADEYFLPDYKLIVPTKIKTSFTEFSAVDSISKGRHDYYTADAMSSAKQFVYPPYDDYLRIIDKDHLEVEELLPDVEPTLIFGIKACDMAAIKILDRIFLTSPFINQSYAIRRQNTVLAVINCLGAGSQCFCASMGTGPFAKVDSGADLVLTRIDESWLVEGFTLKGQGFLDQLNDARPSKSDIINKYDQAEQSALAAFSKKLDTTGLVELLAETTDHPVYKDTAINRCLGCTNCTMVCPTCFCFDFKDMTGIGSSTTTRRRHWDSCQELHFSDISHGSFRQTRKARLRQFVTHKLSTWVKQYQTFGCVGCGRCMTWCPSHIDLTEIAKTIQTSRTAT